MDMHMSGLQLKNKGNSSFMILTKKHVTPPEIFEIISIPLQTAYYDFLVMFYG